MPIRGPSVLGRGVVVAAGAAVPDAWTSCPVVTIDQGALAGPGDVVELLHRHWVAREPVVVELGVDPAIFRTPESITEAPWRLSPTTEAFFDRLHFLVWANNYDARGDGDPIWWWARKADRMGATETPEGPGDVLLGDGTPAWIDGGPRGPIGPDGLGNLAVVSSESVDAGHLVVERAGAPVDAALAPDQLAAVEHRSGPARVIAPAGSGKTRVLTERLRHLVVARGWDRDEILAVAYNKQAQIELETRTAAFSPTVRTLNSLGLWVLREHRGRSPEVLGEREVRRIVDSLIPGRRHRANTDPIGPYVEALGAVRLGLCDPAEVESARGDVEGLAELFDPFRACLADRGVIDFDEQIYGALESLLTDGAFRRRMQARCRHLLVDEFQDLTPAHVLLIRLVASPGLDVFGVGDDDQVIYGHNQASPSFLIDFDTLFPGVPGSGSHALEVNYRCPVAVTDAARNLVGYNSRRVTKSIRSGPGADPSPEAFEVVGHDTDAGASTLVSLVAGWLDDPDTTSDRIAVLCRVNALLLAPQIALVDAGFAVTSVLEPSILDRTGLRAALAYLRIAASPRAMAASDIVEVLRRPTRGLPRWFPDRLARRSAWSVGQVRSIADQVPDKEASKVHRLADDLAMVTEAARGGTTRTVLETVRDEVGLGSAMGMLDQSGRGAAQGSSHLDDLEGLLAVADLHRDLDGFEAWLRGLFARPAASDGITLSTIHRVKGREWDRVIVVGLADGIMPHRLSHDVEEERRVLHVAITRGHRRVAVLADASRPSRFVDELSGRAPVEQRPTRPSSGPGGSPATRRSANASGSRQASRRRPAPGGDAPGPVEAALRAWRRSTSEAIAKPAFTVLSDAHLQGIARRCPATRAELAGCAGIGPTKLERWGDEILEVIETACETSR